MCDNTYFDVRHVRTVIEGRRNSKKEVLTRDGRLRRSLALNYTVSLSEGFQVTDAPNCAIQFYVPLGITGEELKERIQECVTKARV